MINTLLPHSVLDDPYKLYEDCLFHHPLYWDDANKIWAVYSYEHCLKILNEINVKVPPVKHFGVDPTVDFVSHHLVRLSNPPRHEALKKIAFYLFNQLKKIDVANVLFAEMEKQKEKDLIDWTLVCKKIFPAIILKGFDFPVDDEWLILENITSLVKIMSAVNDEQTFRAVGKIVADVYEIVEHYFAKKLIKKEDVKNLAVENNIAMTDLLVMLASNYIGLLIQSYDAGRGLLVNSLRQLLQYKNNGGEIVQEPTFFSKIVTETLRFDPPVHNTKRTATADILIGENIIKNGQAILIVLAAANRDAAKFSHPNVFDIKRSNNDALTFGAGGHMCLAKHFCTGVAAEVLHLVTAKYPRLCLSESKVQYEPLINVRIPESLLITLK